MPWFRLTALLAAGALIAVLPSGSHAVSHGKEQLVALSWGDQIGFVGSTKEEPLLSVESFRKIFREYKQAGTDVVLFRIDVLRWVRDYNWPEPRKIHKNPPPGVLESDQKQWEGAFAAVKQNLLKDIVAVAHEQELRIFAYSSTFDEGIPFNEVWYDAGERSGQGTPQGEAVVHNVPMYGGLISKFTEQHPEYVMVDRSQKKHNWGTLEFAYPEARNYAVGYNRWYLENYPFDGTYIDFRNEFSHPEFGDQFGFAPPIVEEYRRRHGVDILKQQFDVEKWRRLCGEYLTQFIRELHAMTREHSKPLYVGVAQGNYIGLPNGNMYVDWQGWVRERIVEGLVVGIISGQFIFPDRIGYGYVTDMEDGIGLPNLLWDLDANYWPHCAAYGVKLFVRPPLHPAFRGVRIPLAQFLKTKVDGLYLSASTLKHLRELP